MATLYVQFSDSSKTAIVSWFSGSQDHDVYQNLGSVDSSDAIWKSYYDSLPSMIRNGMPMPD